MLPLGRRGSVAKRKSLHPRQHIPPLKPLLQQGGRGADGAVGELQVLVQ